MHKRVKKFGVLRGYTVVELLVIIVVIGILASIGVISYNGYRNRANDAAVQSDLEGISGLLEAYRLRPNDANPSHQFPTTAAILDTLEIQASKRSYNTTISNNMIYCLATTGVNAYQNYSLVAQSASGVIYLMTQDGFKSHSLTQSSLTATLCTTLGMTLVSNGLSAPNTWQTWVHDS